MKKVLYAIMAVAMVSFIGCDKGDDDKIDTGELEWLKVTLRFDTDGKGPEGKAYLFYLENEFVNDPKPLGIWTGIPFINDVNGDKIFSIAEGEIRVNKDQNTGLYINESSVVFTEHGLSSVYGTPKTNGRYVLLVDLDVTPYIRSWMEFKPIDYPVPDIINYSAIEKTFDRDAEHELMGDRFEDW